MLKSIEAVVETDGRITLKEPLCLGRRYRAIVTILDDVEPEEHWRISETTLLSEEALKADWDRDEEDEAWLHLQPER